ncbi:MAG: hypothetical protein KF823_01245 [Xanthomonadales bacterium]|nr:hypothetical protein [Xanthomonadales bacterium]
MAVPLVAFNGATAAPPVAAPLMISAGDSLMWGQGLLPGNRFRELVRARLQADLQASVSELAMARSGARCTPTPIPASNGSVEPDDRALVNRLLSDTAPSIRPFYNPDGFVRELPSATPTTLGQLKAALGMLQAPASGGDPAAVRLILLDGGINDARIINILTPTAALDEGGPLASWEAWLFAAARKVRCKMEDTLRFALTSFPAATVVVNGYFPIFSWYSRAALLRIQAVAAMFAVPGSGWVAPASLDAVARASRIWQIASNHRLRQAVRRIAAEFPGRTVCFARSGIAGPHCLFGPATMLWDYDGKIDALPVDLLDVALLLAGVTPQDEVAVQRRAAVTAAAMGDPLRDLEAIMASVGHPNVAGARDYADSIIDELEFAGLLSPSRTPCDQNRARRRRRCTAWRDGWDFGAMRLRTTMEEACQGAAGGLFGIAGQVLGVAAAAWNRMAAAPAAAADCFAGTGAEIDACAASEATAIAECNATLAETLAGACNISCTQFTNCNDFGAFDPRRYSCRASRIACVALAATRRLACRVGAEAQRAACVAGAIATGAACRAAAVVAASGCAAVAVVAGVVDLAIAVGALLVAGAVALAAVAVVVACRLAQAVVALVGNLLGGIGQALCRALVAVAHVGCLAGTLANTMFGARRGESP